jgi:tetratricopeptide (TPR) repeat protein
LEQTWAFEALVAATAALDGWRAAADVCRANMDRFPDAPLLWLNKAWIFRYVGEEESYQQVVATVLTLASQFAANDQHVPIEIAAMGPCRFSAEQAQQLDSLMRALYIALPSRLTDQQTCGYRALGQMHLRLGQFEESLAALEKSEAKSPGPDPFNFFIRALCEHRLGHDEKARAAFEEGEALIKPLLTESLEQTEPFLPTYQLYQRLLMYREAKAELDIARPKP